MPRRIANKHLGPLYSRGQTTWNFFLSHSLAFSLETFSPSSLIYSSHHHTYKKALSTYTEHSAHINSLNISSLKLSN